MKRIKKILGFFLSYFLAAFLLMSPFGASSADYAFAQQLDGGSMQPFLKTFTVSAYYSPLPCQNRYATGSFESDVRLNGEGVHSADGSLVYPGMIAAPKNYAFGTKMHVPGVGIVAVHDRGGAIRASDGAVGVYDRLDVWMGYGDKGLERALKWGKRTVEVLVYGVNDSIIEQISLADYSGEEQNQCAGMPVLAMATSSQNSAVKVIAVRDEKGRILADLKPGDAGEAVRALQTELGRLNYFRDNVTGNYGEVTEHAVFKFQQSQGLVGDAVSAGAGVFGPKTRDALNDIVANRDYSRVIIAQATDAFYEKTRLVAWELDFGIVDKEVKDLQEFLKAKGYFDGALTTDYYGPVTRQAVIKFQLANQIIQSENDTGAGRVGPETLKFINEA